MKVNKIMALKLLVALSLTIGFTSCSKKGSTKGGSTATGWKINDKKGGFQYNTKFKQQETPPGMVSVEGGTFTMGKVEDDVMHDWNNTPNKQHVQSFFMDETEVTNIMYAEYLFWLKAVYPPTEENYKHIYNGAIPDTLVWRNRLGYNETMTNNYLRHPAYADYPVVGVNWIQATEFCDWRTNRVNENILEREGYLKKDNKVNLGKNVTADSNFDTETYINSPSKTFGGNGEIVLKKEMGKGGRREVADSVKNVYAQRSSGIILPEYRLPTEAEWEYAALALVGNREYNIYKGQKKYPWKGQYTRSGKRQYRGDQLANFKQGKGDYGGIAGWSDDGADITNKVKSYAPNDFGLYDMAGNVAEWVADVYRPIVDDEANDFNYYRGNVYMKNKIGEDGTVEIITSENIKYDTLSNGKIMARNFPGQIAQVPVDENETYLRQNFSTSDNKNYRDGDRQSSRYFDFGTSEEETTSKKEDPVKRMYQSPMHKIDVDSIGSMSKKYDKSDKRTTLIDDNVRVYKGGSWRDRAYWLDPASRRYFPQDMATDYIGFRCAMSKVGPKSNKKTPRGNVKK
ncbi:Gliding motility lipoprotein precursor GldJ [Flavobacterium indicum GPTSA100-9 = DSM 17447]|uniref:Gliding motility lipoprotein GldJ n=1 Tax=Flavobacterium indicum (strain DSM 17447 / CIP 109464 / GPTSA100-9) TaxID=1094466 RepID=H8XSN5_FLAIG|nr:gliding motility lipoprotein GldJ [Flavobacterium indicum]CCG52620.1 Gliding motility lipoprotein precursor GldJ [Flavobacterium indicum GPTSA100-9 = DSM 17447]